MENASEALIMAGSVLIFVVALSVAMLAFTTARQSIDAVLKFSDREMLLDSVTDEELNGRFYYVANGDTKRYVSLETIIPTLYRAYAESYKVIFLFPDDYYLYEDSAGNKIHSIGIQEADGLDDDVDFIEGILYGKYNPEKGNFGIGARTLPGKSLFDKIKELVANYKIEESLGTYYLEDNINTTDKVVNDLGEVSYETVSEVNKRELRVITYKFINK